MSRAVSPFGALLQSIVLYAADDAEDRNSPNSELPRRSNFWGLDLDDDAEEGVHLLLLSLIEYEEINGIEGYQKGEEVTVFGTY